MIQNKKFYKELITCTPITWKNITFHPIKISQKDVFYKYANILTISQQALPVELASVPYLRMLYMIDIAIGESYLKQLQSLLYMCVNNDSAGIVEVKFINIGEEIEIDFNGNRINEAEFHILRAIIAEQNLLKLPDESHNIELAQARQDIAFSMHSANIDMDFEHELYFLSNNIHRTLDECYEMPLREFYMRLNSKLNQINNDQSALIGSANMQWKGENPYPSPLYPAKNDNRHLSQGNDMMMSKASGVLDKR